MLARITSVLFWTYIGILCILFLPIAFLIWITTYPFDKRRIALHRFTSFWAAMFTWPNPHWNVSVYGRENLKPSKPRIIVSNHQSFVDIPVLYRMWTHFKWVSKTEVFRIPIAGWNMRMNEYIELVRGSTKSQAKMMKDCEKALKNGSSVLIFPEGTRSTTGTITKFKRGAFELAKRTGYPILPVVINGSSEALPKYGLVLRGIHRMKVQILPEITQEEYANLDADELTNKVQEIITEEYEKERMARLSKKKK